MSIASTLAGAPEFEFEEKTYAFPMESLLAVAGRIDEAAEALIMPEHCIEAVPLVLEGLRRAGWKFSPPA